MQQSSLPFFSFPRKEVGFPCLKDQDIKQITVSCPLTLCLAPLTLQYYVDETMSNRNKFCCTSGIHSCQTIEITLDYVMSFKHRRRSYSLIWGTKRPKQFIILQGRRDASVSSMKKLKNLLNTKNYSTGDHETVFIICRSFEKPRTDRYTYLFLFLLNHFPSAWKQRYQNCLSTTELNTCTHAWETTTLRDW